MPSVLIICTANVCRSPLAEFRLRECLRGKGLEDAVTVVSAGSATRDGMPLCSHVHDRLGAPDAGRPHVSRRLTQEHLEAADLLLVPDLANRARLVAREPSVRRRAFTLREAAYFIDGTVDATPSRLVGQAADERFAAWVSGLHQARFSLPPLASGGSRFRRHATSGPEILDGHNLGARLHREALDAVDASVATIGQALVTVLV